MKLNFISKYLTLLFIITTTTAIANEMGGYVTPPPEVCLYSEDKFQGKSKCFANKERADLFNEDDTMIGNDNTSSIQIPDGMLATIYKNDDYSPPYFNLTESIGQRALADLYMDNEITSIRVANSPIEGCSERCVILKRMQLPLSDIFSHQWSDPNHPNKQVLLSFDINDQSVFMTELSLGPVIWFSNRDLFIFNNPQNSEPLAFRIHPDANRFSLLFHLNNNHIAVDFLESLGTKQIALSPTIMLSNAPFDRPVETSAIIINNTGKQPLIIDQIVIAASTEDIQPIHHRSERDTAGTLGCTFIPALAIYNYVTHSHCNQGDTLWSKVKHWFSNDNKDKSVVITAKSPLLEPKLPETQFPENSSGATLTLTKLDTQLHDQALTLPATAQFCKTSIDNILAARYPRDIEASCQQWVLRVLADFTLLFGDSMRDWTSDILRQILNQIHIDGTTTHPGNDPVAESRLVNQIREVIRNMGMEETLFQISHAFDYARLNYARYLVHNPAATESPAATQRLPLGQYSLSLASYHYPTEPPAVRIRENNQWVTLPNFEVNILDTTLPEGPDINAELMTESQVAMGSWYRSYIAAPVNLYNTGEPWSEHDRTVEAARISSLILWQELLDPARNYIFAVTWLKGEIYSVLAARRDESFERSDENYYIEAFVTDPRYVLRPDDEWAIRGTGSAALHQLAHYLQDRGVRALRMRAASQPASRVATKLGFQHDEF